jgi:hypothetical protein
VGTNVDPRQKCRVRVSRHVDERFYRVFDPESRSVQFVDRSKAVPGLQELLRKVRTVEAVATVSIEGRWCRLEPVIR